METARSGSAGRGRRQRVARGERRARQHYRFVLPLPPGPYTIFANIFGTGYSIFISKLLTSLYALWGAQLFPNLNPL